ncbi:MAG: SulP family inorganic anion transporter [Parachlamydiaceae bacterium]|nr:SulP family inorganic anion transporter [Parachlamydiaceae bacterium]
MGSVQNSIDDISLLPFKKDLVGYRWTTFRQDLMAGLSVALLTLPQAVGYSLLAGLPLFCGLFAAIYSSLIAALFGSSRHLVVGPSNAMAVLVQSGAAQILFTYYRDLSGPEREMMALQVVTQISLLVGLLQLLVAGFKLGRLTQFVSHSVVVGYMVGTAIALFVTQLFPLLGIARPLGVSSFYETGVYLFTKLPTLHWATAIIGVGSCLCIALLRRMDRRVPAALITFVVAGTIVQLFGLNIISVEADVANGVNFIPDRVLLIKDTSSLLEVIPHFQLPLFDLGILNGTLPVAFALALVSIMESTSVAKSIAASSGQRLSVNQEIFGISLGNLLSSFLAGMPVSGSPSRSSINYNYGAQTRFAAIFSAGVVALILFFFGHLVSMIPIASLAGLLLYTASNIVNPKQFFLCIKATGSDAFVLWVTMLSCLFFSLDVAFYIGIAISVTLYLKKAAVPQLKEYEIDESGELKNIDANETGSHRPIRVIKVEGELFFGAADLFQTTLKTIAEDDTSTKVIILQLKNARDIDATACLALQQLFDYLKGSGRHLIACGLTWQIWEILSDSGIVAMLGKENLIVFDERHPHSYMQRALVLAKRLIAADEEAERKNLPPPIVIDEALPLPAET